MVRPKNSADMTVSYSLEWLEIPGKHQFLKTYLISKASDRAAGKRVPAWHKKIATF